MFNDLRAFLDKLEGEGQLVPSADHAAPALATITSHT